MREQVASAPQEKVAATVAVRVVPRPLVSLPRSTAPCRHPRSATPPARAAFQFGALRICLIQAVVQLNGGGLNRFSVFHDRVRCAPPLAEAQRNQ